MISELGFEVWVYEFYYILKDQGLICFFVSFKYFEKI